VPIVAAWYDTVVVFVPPVLSLRLIWVRVAVSPEELTTNRDVVPAKPLTLLNVMVETPWALALRPLTKLGLAPTEKSGTGTVTVTFANLVG
jgi:hypothetical protein